ncbi:hypothetical protein NUW58_g548 [Xylaria curta]|uniref:Uncharacterized protein n=1 Tax=Xylaria curta TaxID=42375 RepID=A0ACC1PQW2_9PEZI|nr:hypothetical protein NUW58_g548 [Xylaria curta]
MAVVGIAFRIHYFRAFPETTNWLVSALSHARSSLRLVVSPFHHCPFDLVILPFDPMKMAGVSEYFFHFVAEDARQPSRARFHLVEGTADGQYDQLAISGPWDGQSHLHCRVLNKPIEASVTQSSGCLIRDQGGHQTREIATTKSRGDALDGIEQYGRVKGEAYRRYLGRKDCRAFIKWTIFLNNIESSFPMIQDRFIQLLLQISTHIPHENKSQVAELTAQEFVGKWRQEVRRWNKNNIIPGEEYLYTLALLRCIFILSYGGRNARCSATTTPAHRIWAVGFSIGLYDVGQEDIEMDVDPDQACQFLNTCNVFKNKPIAKEEVEEWECKLYVHIFATWEGGVSR